MTARATSLLRFARRRLFATPLDAVITLACCWVLVRVAEPLMRWMPYAGGPRGFARWSAAQAPVSRENAA